MEFLGRERQRRRNVGAWEMPGDTGETGDARWKRSSAPDRVWAEISGLCHVIRARGPTLMTTFPD